MAKEFEKQRFLDDNGHTTSSRTDMRTKNVNLATPQAVMVIPGLLPIIMSLLQEEAVCVIHQLLKKTTFLRVSAMVTAKETSSVPRVHCAPNKFLLAINVLCIRQGDGNKRGGENIEPFSRTAVARSKVTTTSDVRMFSPHILSR